MDYCTSTGEPDIGPLVALAQPSTLKEVEEAVGHIWYTIATDEHMVAACQLAKKQPTVQNLRMSYIFRQAAGLMSGSNFRAKVAAEAASLWTSTFQRRQLRLRRLRLMSENADDGGKSRDEVMRVYGLKADDMARLDYFVRQCLQGLPSSSLTRCLYIWSDRKMTGKSTFARALAKALNGGVAAPESSIGRELQFGNFDRPAALDAVAVVMDEAFVGHSSKNWYNKLKATMTCPTVTIDIKFQSPVTTEVARNYIFTSNQPPHSIISDSGERRFSVIEMGVTPVPMAAAEIDGLMARYVRAVSLWPVGGDFEQFARNDYEATAQEIIGERGVQMNDLTSAFLSEEFSNWVENCTYKLTFPGKFKQFLAENDRYAKFEDDDLKKVVAEIFGEPKRSGKAKGTVYYNVSDVRRRIAELTGEGGEIAAEREDFGEKLPY